ncbi:hypothetical protein DD599_27080, partial [Enterobacter cloacae complex sp. CH23B]
KHFLCFLKRTTFGIHINQDIAKHDIFFQQPLTNNIIPQSLHSKRRHSELEAPQALFVLSQAHHICHT